MQVLEPSLIPPTDYNTTGQFLKLSQTILIFAYREKETVDKQHREDEVPRQWTNFTIVVHVACVHDRIVNLFA